MDAFSLLVAMNAVKGTGSLTTMSVGLPQILCKRRSAVQNRAK